jgi:hypothetical protein
MRADQGEAILVRIHVLKRHLPTADLVAEVALRAILPPMNVGMAVLAIATNVGEHGMYVALLTSDACM